MSFALIRRIANDGQAEAPDQSKVNVDMKVTSTQALQESMKTIQAELEARATLSKDLLADRLDHIEAEVNANGPTILSLEHLELYLQFLERINPSETNTPLQPRMETLSKKISLMLTQHPLSGMARSGDREDSAEGGALLKVPLGRRRQMFAMVYCILFTGPFLVVFTTFLLWYLLPYSTYILLGYVTWVVYDNRTRQNPSYDRVKQWWRRTAMYEHFRDYFPIRIFKARRNTKFDPKRNYLFCYHPHGVQSAGAFSCAAAATGFDELFPGLEVSVQTLGINFVLPFTRENLISLGMGDASKPAIIKALTQKPGSGAVLVTGGAKESMFAHPGVSKVVMEGRYGFVKCALESGAMLVPMWGFGENNVYENLAITSPTLRKWQRRIQKMISVAPLLVAGRGIFSYSGGVIPHRRPISVVVGTPIDVGPPDKNPTPERIQQVQEQYRAAVVEVFERHRDIYDPKAEDITFV